MSPCRRSSRTASHISSGSGGTGSTPGYRCSSTDRRSQKSGRSPVRLAGAHFRSPLWIWASRRAQSITVVTNSRIPGCNRVCPVSVHPASPNTVTVSGRQVGHRLSSKATQLGKPRCSKRSTDRDAQGTCAGSESKTRRRAGGERQPTGETERDEEGNGGRTRQVGMEGRTAIVEEHPDKLRVQHQPKAVRRGGHRPNRFAVWVVPSTDPLARRRDVGIHPTTAAPLRLGGQLIELASGGPNQPPLAVPPQPEPRPAAGEGRALVDPDVRVDKRREKPRPHPARADRLQHRRGPRRPLERGLFKDAARGRPSGLVALEPSKGPPEQVVGRGGRGGVAPGLAPLSLERQREPVLPHHPRHDPRGLVARRPNPAVPHLLRLHKLLHRQVTAAVELKLGRGGGSDGVVARVLPRARHDRDHDARSPVERRVGRGPHQKGSGANVPLAEDPLCVGTAQDSKVPRHGIEGPRRHAQPRGDPADLRLPLWRRRPRFGERPPGASAKGEELGARGDAEFGRAPGGVVGERHPDIR
eukprot:m.127312 g.127312  ORF g.127312 m.127312 type:complete len:528 (-) comp13595_c0_seq2:932-2515(-)